MAFEDIECISPAASGKPKVPPRGVAVSVRSFNAAGKFLAKRSRKGEYALSVNTATAAGLFSMEFDPFVEDRCEPIRPANGQPPHFVFKASAQMLEVDDE